MAINHRPETGAWYINMNNQFLRIWAVIYEQGEAKRVVLHYLNGSRKNISLKEWSQLELIRYPEQSDRHNGTRG